MFFTQKLFLEQHSADEEEDEEESDDSSDSDDNALIRAMNASTRLLENEELIELDTESEDEYNEAEENDINQYETQEVNDNNRFQEISLRKRMLRYNPRFYMSRLLLKKSIRILKMKSAKKGKKDKTETVVTKSLTEPSNDEIKSLLDVDENNSSIPIETNKETLDKEMITEENFTEISHKDANVVMNKDHTPLETENEENMKPKVTLYINEVHSKTSSNLVKNILEEKNHDNNKKKDDTKTNSLDNKNQSISDNQEQERDEDNYNSLLNEISNCTIEEIMNRYVFRTGNNITDQNITVEDFSEDLFACLHQNKQEILIAQQVWNGEFDT